MTGHSESGIVIAGLARRLAAMLYDTLVIAALLIIATIPLLLATDGQRIPGGNRYYQAYLLALIALFFMGFWVTRGRTLGMLAWRLRVERADGSRILWGQAMLRFAGAAISMTCLGLGYLWMYVDTEGRTWHDRLSNSRVVVTPKRKRAKNSHEMAAD